MSNSEYRISNIKPRTSNPLSPLATTDKTSNLSFLIAFRDILRTTNEKRQTNLASLFGHALAGYAIGKIWTAKTTAKLIVLCIVCTVIPDADVLAFTFGIEYESMWGHRGFSHSILFAFLFALLLKFIFFKEDQITSRKGFALFLVFFICTISHGIFDAMTSGGLGVGFFIPFDSTRYFLPFRPIKVSPIGAAKFFSEWGWSVLKSEAIWIGIPSLLLIILRLIINGKKN